MGIDYNRPSKGAPDQPPSSGGVSLGKVRLTKDTSTPSSVSLQKGGSRPFRFNLNWNARPAQSGGGFLKRLTGAGQIDLDLGCLFELADGSKGVVQALGNSFGSLDRPPYLKLDKDDRSGAVAEGENLFMSAQHLSEIRRVVVFAFIYEGVPNWSQADGVVTIHQDGAGDIEIPLDEASSKGMCAIALIENNGGDMKLTRQVRYVDNHRDLDRAYGWGLNWTAGRK